MKSLSCILLCVIYIEYFYIRRHNNFLQKYTNIRPLLGRHQVYCLCLDAELFLIWIHILNITCKIMLGNKTHGIIYFLVQLCWN
jgi:hypothetical protein